MAGNFRSDNEAPVAPEIMQALTEANHGTAEAYAEDDWSARLDAHFSDLFETRVQVLPLSTGTAANAVALASMSQPWSVVLCHRAAHIFNDESGACEMLGSGLRLSPVDGADGQFSPESLRAAITASEGHGVHSMVPSAVSITQATECGTVYQPAQVEAIAEVAHSAGLHLHMDGARFANAVSRLGCSPAEISWKAGVDALSFGASKNGCMAAEALLLFGDAIDMDIAERHRKRSGHLLSKMRFVSAQLLRYTEDGLWLQLAARANDNAARFAGAVEAHAGAQLEFPVQANEVFLKWDDAGFRQLETAGIRFHRWPGRNDLARLVFSWAHSETELDGLCRALEG